MLNRYLDPDMYPSVYLYRRTVPQHDGGVLRDCDWGGPCDWTAVCSCGWAGATYTNYYPYGGKPGEGGTSEDALHDLLHHQGYDLDAEHAAITQQYTASLTSIAELAFAPVDEETLTDILDKTALIAEGMKEAFTEYELFKEAFNRPQWCTTDTLLDEHTPETN